jgi:hypothetical protein
MFRAAFTDLYEMKADKLFRNVPANIHELRLALAGLPKDMKVLAESEAGVSENTVDELCARTTWQLDLVVTTPRKLHPKSVVKISKATCCGVALAAGH